MAIFDDLPPELLDAILVTLSIDGKAHHDLIACSAVAKRWRTIALPYMFAILKLKSTNSRSFTDVITFLDTHPDLTSYTKNLWFCSPIRSHLIEVDPDIVRAFFVRLPSLQEVAFDGVMFISSPIGSVGLEDRSEVPLPSPPKHTPAGFGGTYQLKRVILNHCHVDNTSLPLFHVLCLCEMDTLKLTLVTERFMDGFKDASLDPAALPRLIRVRSLKVGMMTSPGPRAPALLLEHLGKTLDPSCLRSVQVACSGWEAVDRTGAFLHNAGKNITTLKLGLLWPVYYYRDPDIASSVVPAERWDALSLSSCPAIQSICFHIVCLWSFTAKQCIACAHVLRRLSPTLRSVAIELEVLEDAASLEQETMDLPVIEQALMEERFPDLESVTVYVESRLDVAECREAAARVMPRLNAAGLLRVVSH